jgi:hypothetical protein
MYQDRLRINARKTQTLRAFHTGGRFSFASFGGFSPVMLTSVPTPADKSYPKRATFGFGIVKSVYILPVPAVAITQFVPQTFYAGGHPTSILSDGNHSGFAVRARVAVWAASATSGEFRVSLPTVPGASISVRANLSAGESNVTLVLPAAATMGVKLWHPRNHGGQPLYNITASFVPSFVPSTLVHNVAKATRRIGFRHVALVTVNESNTMASQGGTGTFTYFLRVNGESMRSIIPHTVYLNRFSHIMLSCGSLRRQVLRCSRGAPARCLLTYWKDG